MYYRPKTTSMSHLPTERLAALADEAPTAEELAHLAACALCARERETYRALLTSAQLEQTRIGVPLTHWESLQPALVADGVIDDGETPWVGASQRRAHAQTHWSRRLLRVAAAVLLVAGGAIVGRVSATSSTEALADRGTTSAVNAADTALSFGNVEEARVARRRYEAMYQSATAYLARHDTATYESDSPAAIRTRLAALDRVDQTMREALEQAPADPVINGYYLTTLGEREATLRQLNASLPSAVRVNIY